MAILIFLYYELPILFYFRLKLILDKKGEIRIMRNIKIEISIILNITISIPIIFVIRLLIQN